MQRPLRGADGGAELGDRHRTGRVGAQEILDPAGEPTSLGRADPGRRQVEPAEQRHPSRLLEGVRKRCGETLWFCHRGRMQAAQRRLGAGEILQVDQQGATHDLLPTVAEKRQRQPIEQLVRERQYDHVAGTGSEDEQLLVGVDCGKLPWPDGLTAVTGGARRASHQPERAHPLRHGTGALDSARPPRLGKLHSGGMRHGEHAGERPRPDLEIFLPPALGCGGHGIGTVKAHAGSEACGQDGRQREQIPEGLVNGSGAAVFR